MTRLRSWRTALAGLCLLAGTCAAAPPWWGRTLEAPDGSALRLDALGARVVVVDLWATWCEPCRAALPHLDALADDLGPRGVAIVALAQDEDASKVRAFVAALGARHLKFAVDVEHAAAEALGPETLPSTFVLSADGRVLARFEGYREGDERRVRAAVEAALGGGGAPISAAP